MFVIVLIFTVVFLARFSFYEIFGSNSNVIFTLRFGRKLIQQKLNFILHLNRDLKQDDNISCQTVRATTGSVGRHSKWFTGYCHTLSIFHKI